MEARQVIQEAVKVLREGGVILYPTDTIWGIGCDATNPAAVARVYGIKRRSDSKALVLLASDLDMVARYVDRIPPIAIDLVEVNDRPMTIIYPGAIAGKAPVAEAQSPETFLGNTGEAAGAAQTPPDTGDRYHLAWNTVASDGSVGIRIPMSEFCRDLAARLGRPLVSTSANISGEPSPQKFSDIPQSIRDAVDYIVPKSLDDGTGLASQIIKVELDGQVRIIRA